MNKIEYRELNSTATHDWVRALLDILLTEDDELVVQQSIAPLLRKVRENDGKEFVKFIHEQIDLYGAHGNLYHGEEIPTIPSEIELTAGSIKSMPSNDTVKFYESLKDLPFEKITSPYFWGAFTLAEIENDSIKPLWLAHYDPSVQENTVSRKFDLALEDFEKFNARLQKAKNESEKEKIRSDFRKAISDLFRTVIRTLIAPGLFRGAPELYTNCALARAYWRGRIGNICAEKLGIEPVIAVQTLADSWGEYSDNLSGSLTVIREENIISALVSWNIEYVKKNKIQKINANKTLRAAIHSAGEISTGPFLGLVAPKLIVKMIAEKMNVSSAS